MNTQDDREKSDSPQFIKDNHTDLYKEIVRFAKDEVKWVASAYKWASLLITVIVVVGIYFTYHSLSDFKNEMREEVERQKSAFSNQIDQVRAKVENRIREEFNKDNLTKMIKEQAQRRIGETTDMLIEKQITKKIAPQLKKIKEESEFMITVIRAKNDDRKAFDKLKYWGKDPNLTYSSEAQKALAKIIDEHAFPIIIAYSVPWPPGIDPSNMTLTKLEKMFDSAPLQVRIGLLDYIWKRQDISKKEKMLFIVKVLKNDGSLKVVEYAGRHFMQESKQKIEPLRINEHLAWWEKNKDKFDDK